MEIYDFLLMSGKAAGKAHSFLSHVYLSIRTCHSDLHTRLPLSSHTPFFNGYFEASSILLPHGRCCQNHAEIEPRYCALTGETISVRVSLNSRSFEGAIDVGASLRRNIN